MSARTHQDEPKTVEELLKAILNEIRGIRKDVTSFTSGGVSTWHHRWNALVDAVKKLKD